MVVDGTKKNFTKTLQVAPFVYYTFKEVKEMPRAKSTKPRKIIVSIRMDPDSYDLAYKLIAHMKKTSGKDVNVSEVLRQCLAFGLAAMYRASDLPKGLIESSGPFG